MAGIGVKLQKIYDRRTILANLAGFGYSTMVTIAPMFVVIGNVMLMSHFLGYETVGSVSYTHLTLTTICSV